jgi:ABC-2 type transport system permease protein
MRNVSALTRRELGAYFLSPTAYIVLTVFVLLTGWIFFDFINAQHEASILPVVYFMGWMLLFISPMLTMRLFADEFQTGTIETLMTAPVTTLEVVLSKYLASLFFLLVVLVPPMLYGAILFSVGDPDPGPIVAGYLGLFLLGSYFLALGMVASACVRTQISAAVITIILLLILQILSFIVPAENVDAFSKALRYISYWNHFYGVFTKGVIDTRDVVYFVSVSLFCVFLTTVIVTVRRWR